MVTEEMYAKILTDERDWLKKLADYLDEVGKTYEADIAWKMLECLHLEITNQFKEPTDIKVGMKLG